MSAHTTMRLQAAQAALAALWEEKKFELDTGYFVIDDAHDLSDEPLCESCAQDAVDEDGAELHSDGHCITQTHCPLCGAALYHLASYQWFQGLDTTQARDEDLWGATTFLKDIKPTNPSLPNILNVAEALINVHR